VECQGHPSLGSGGTCNRYHGHWRCLDYSGGGLRPSSLGYGGSGQKVSGRVRRGRRDVRRRLPILREARCTGPVRPAVSERIVAQLDNPVAAWLFDALIPEMAVPDSHAGKVSHNASCGANAGKRRFRGTREPGQLSLLSVFIEAKADCQHQRLTRSPLSGGNSQARTFGSRMS
jgi:hypothetical protein